MAISITINVSDNSEAQRVATAFNAKLGVAATQAGVKIGVATLIKEFVSSYEREEGIKNLSVSPVNPT